MWSGLLARIITAASVGPEDTAQVAFNYGLFTGGFGLHYGLEKVGATVVPMSGGNTERQLMLMQDFGTTALISTPSYALHIAEVAESMGLDTSKMKLRVGLFGGEPSSQELRNEIEKRLHIVSTDNYGLSEVVGPGVAGECIFANGMHIAEDHRRARPSGRRHRRLHQPVQPEGLQIRRRQAGPDRPARHRPPL